MIKEAISALVSGHSLSQTEAAGVMEEIMTGQATPAQVAGFLVALRMKGETAQELAGMARVMREKALPVEVEGPLVDTCGTGGDGLGTFNISTAAAIVAASAGVRVAKHGNRGMSSACGSADVLEALGVHIALGPQGVARCIREAGIGFMFAPLFHPAMKHAVAPRREIGVRTAFNLLGPLTNPARAQHQVIGVPGPEVAQKVAGVLQLLGTRRSLVVYGEDGLDEATLGGHTFVLEVKGGSLRRWEFTPGEAGLNPAPVTALKGGDLQRNREMIEAVLQGRDRGPVREVVLLNAGLALLAGEAVADLREGVREAGRAVDSGRAWEKLQAWAQLTHSLAQEGEGGAG